MSLGISSSAIQNNGSNSRDKFLSLAVTSNAIQKNWSKSRDEFMSTEFCKMLHKLMSANLHINSWIRNLITFNINLIVAAQFYHLHFNLIRIWICLHKRGTYKQVVHYSQLSYERTLGTQNTSCNHSPGRDNQYNENIHKPIGTCIFPQPIYRRPG